MTDWIVKLGWENQGKGTKEMDETAVGHGDGVDGRWIRMIDCSQEHWEFYQIEIFLTAISNFSPTYKLH